MRVVGREQFAASTGTNDTVGTVLGSGVLLVAAGLGYLVQYEATYHGVSRAMRRGATPPTPPGAGAFRASVRRVPWMGSSMWGLVAGNGQVERTWPYTQEGLAAANRYLASNYPRAGKGRLVGPDQRSRSRSKPSQSAGTPTPKEAADAGIDEWRRGGKIRGFLK